MCILFSTDLFPKLRTALQAQWIFPDALCSNTLSIEYGSSESIQSEYLLAWIVCWSARQVVLLCRGHCLCAREKRAG